MLAAKQEAEELLRSLEIQFGNTTMVPKKPNGTAGSAVTLSSNLHLLDVPKEAELYRYQVNVYAIFMKGKRDQPNREEVMIDYTTRVRDDFLSVERRKICHELLKLYAQKNEDRFKKNRNLLYYDLSRSLFSLIDLEIPNGFEDCIRKEEVGQPHMGTVNLKHYVLVIKPVTDAKTRLTIGGDHNIVSIDAANIDHSQEQFLDIATAQGIFDNPDKYINYSASLCYLVIPGVFGFTDADCPGFPTNSSFLGIGCNKTTRIVTDDHGGSRMALSINVAKSPFHTVDPVVEKVRRMLPRVDLANLGNDAQSVLNWITKFLKGLHVVTTYPQDPTRLQIFMVDEVMRETARTHIITLGADQHQRRITIEQYFHEAYGITLNYPDFPLVVRLVGGKPRHYPMELLFVCDGQRVKTHQQTSEQSQSMIRKCAVPPSKKVEEIARIKHGLNLDRDPHLSRLAIRSSDEPLNAEARVLEPPTIEFLDQEPERPKHDTWTWTGPNKYLKPAKCCSWSAYSFCDQKDLKQTDWKKFVMMHYYDMVILKGMQFPPPEEVDVIPPRDFDDVLKCVAKRGCEFVFFAHPNGLAGNPFHDGMKLAEQRTEVVTQGVRMKTVQNILGQPDSRRDTLQNIVNKTNIKMGGLNYGIGEREFVDLLHDSLIIGFSMQHPAGGLGLVDGASGENNKGQAGPSTHIPTKKARNMPSVIGYSANIGQEHSFEFVGDYKFQEPGRIEKLEHVGHIVKLCVEKFKQLKTKFPARIILYRNASGEGSYEHILKYEVPYIERLMNGINCSSKLTILVVNKLQGIAFFPEHINVGAKPPEQNIKPGTVIDTGVVHPTWSEFFLASHRALQGTARVPRYNVLLDKSDMTMDQLQSMTFHLCFGHQIVNMPTSLPSPVYIATEYAKRGYNNYNAAIARGAVFDNFEEANAQLTFEGKVYLDKMRVNA